MKTIESWAKLKQEFTIQAQNISEFIDKCEGIPFPVVYRDEDNSVSFVWNCPNFYIDVEFLKDGRYDWFIKHRVDDVEFCENEEPTSCDKLPEEFFELFYRYLGKNK